jgi:hypothetical protein
MASIVLSGSIKEGVYAASGTGMALASSNGGIQVYTMTGAGSFTDSLENGECIALRIIDGDINAPSFPAMKWVTGSPTMTGDDQLVIWKDGSNLIGSAIGELV